MMILAEGTSTVVDAILGVVPSLLSLATTCFTAVTDNPVTLVYMGVTFVGIGFGIFGMMKRSARGR